MHDLNAVRKLKESILKDYDRLGENDTFKFACHPGVSCFNQCCSDVNIFLTPYDVLRLKNRLNMSSEEFLAKYSLTPIDKNQQYPVVMLKMLDDDNKSCPFVNASGCSVYQDRPWSCRMYPLGLAAPKEEQGVPETSFYFLMKEDVCHGFSEDKTWTVKGWMDDQGVVEYDESGKPYREITLHNYFQAGKALEPQKMEMFHMVCYNLDKFRLFLFNTTFLNRFDVPADIQEKIKNDDEELLRFGFQWLKFALFGEDTVKIKGEAKQQVLHSKMK